MPDSQGRYYRGETVLVSCPNRAPVGVQYDPPNIGYWFFTNPEPSGKQANRSNPQGWVIAVNRTNGNIYQPGPVSVTIPQSASSGVHELHYFFNARASDLSARQGSDPTGYTYPYTGQFTVSPDPAPVYGCTNPKAKNYNPKATVDDGSCVLPVYGCTNPKAKNYNPKATDDDGSCILPVYGCTDPKATNYNPKATDDDGSCTYQLIIKGCTDPKATNYNPNATQDDGSCTYAPPGTTPDLLSMSLAQDAHRRPLAAKTGGAGVLGYYSNDAGHAFQGGTTAAADGTKPGVIDADASCGCVSLLLDQPVNRYRAIYTRSTGLYTAAGPVIDGFLPDAAPAALQGVSGTYPVAASHATDRLFCLMAYISGGALTAASSGDGGANWAAGSVITAGLDFSASGRAGLTLLGETACVVYASGNTLLAKTSADRGASWGAAVTITTQPAFAAGPYTGLSLLGWQGRLWLLVFAGSPAAPVLLVSDDLAVTWADRSASLPAVAAPSALGVIPHSGQLRLGMTHRSDDGAGWAAD